METPADDTSGAPDSWEMADLDASMSRLLLSSRNSSASSTLPPDAVDEAASPQQDLPACVERAGGVPVEAVSQVDQFLREALEKPRERLAILRMEQDIEKFIRDPTRQQLDFQSLPNSYLRLAAHRVAQHYHLHSIAIPDNSMPDGSGSRILLYKTSMNSQPPPVRLADILVNLPQEDTNVAFKVAIKQRSQKHSQNMRNTNTSSSRTDYQKSVEERKEEYNRARARIFNSNESSTEISSPEVKINLPDSIHDCFVPMMSENKPVNEGSENYIRSSSASSSGSGRLNRAKTEKDPVVSRHKMNSRVAIFRDREVESKDPDYDRTYERYIQRFDPGFGFSGGPYTVQPLYAPAVNYNTEFPQLGSGHMAQTPADHQPRPFPSHLQGTGLSPSVPSTVQYGPPDGVRAAFSSNHARGHSTPIYMNSSQYSAPLRHGISYPHPTGHIQTFTQTHVQQPDTRFGLARPR